MGNVIYFVVAEDRTAERCFAQAKSLENQRQVWSGLPFKTYYRVVDSQTYPAVDLAGRRAEYLLGVNGSDPYDVVAAPEGAWCLALKIAATQVGFVRMCFFGLRNDSGPPSPGIPGSLTTFPSPSFDKPPPPLPEGGTPFVGDGYPNHPLGHQPPRS
ncbi:MAG: hypothetical protein ACRETL_03965 [Gammaproteobacteria bacterium]